MQLETFDYLSFSSVQLFIRAVTFFLVVIGRLIVRKLDMMRLSGSTLVEKKRQLWRLVVVNFCSSSVALTIEILDAVFVDECNEWYEKIKQTYPIDRSLCARFVIPSYFESSCLFFWITLHSPGLWAIPLPMRHSR
jgi:hypothetical protein